MKKITLTRPWSYVTPAKTIDYPTGEHEVSDEVAKAFEAEHEEKTDGDGAAETRPARGTRAAQG